MWWWFYQDYPQEKCRLCDQHSVCFMACFTIVVEQVEFDLAMADTSVLQFENVRYLEVTGISSVDFCHL